MSTGSTYTRYGSEGDVEEDALSAETISLLSLNVREAENTVVSMSDAEVSELVPVIVDAEEVQMSEPAVDP